MTASAKKFMVVFMSLYIFYESKLILSLSTTIGLFWRYVWIDPIYSPRTPRNVNKIPNIKNIPITTGAYPIGNLSQKRSFATKKDNAVNKLKKPIKKPSNEATLIGTFEWLTIPNIAKSNKL